MSAVENGEQGMRNIRFGNNEVTSPGKCACCLANGTEEIEIVKQTAANLAAAVAVKGAGGSSILARSLQQRARTSVPYCETCADHVRWTTRRGWFGVILLFLRDLTLGGVIASMAFEALTPKALAGKGWVQLTAAILFLIGVLFATFIRTLSRPKAPLARGHSNLGHSIEITSWSSSSIELKCHNDQFAQLLQAANRGSALLPPIRPGA